MASAVLVIPCYNEEDRIQPGVFAEFFRRSGTHVLFVDDGSRDGTAAVLQRICDTHPTRASLLKLAVNSGKAEAVRQGVLAAARRDVDFVGFWDADLATPLEAVDLFIAEFAQHPGTEIVIGSRVQMLGRRIIRKGLRHYGGRTIATIVSLILELEVYDTQCGAKLFRRTPTLQQLFGTPFRSRWLFDVEILARLQIERAHGAAAPVEECVRELPLPLWRDVDGSKLKLSHLVRVAGDLWHINKWRRRELNSRASETLEVRARATAERL